MEIVERREHDGVWWARDPGGAWHRWNVDANGWEGPLTPPWPPEPAPRPDEAAIVATAMAAGAATARALGDGPPASSGDEANHPMNRIDAWWNREFPPFSKRRLAFGLIALPVIAAIVEFLWAAAGRSASLPRYLFVCVAGGTLLAVAWLPGMRAIAERLRASGAFDTRSPWPWRRRRDAPPPPPLPPLRSSFGRDFLVALPFSAAIVTIMSVTVAGTGDTFSAGGLVAIAIGSVFSAGLVALRTSVWSLVIFCVAGGLFGGIAMVLLSLLSWSDPNVPDFYLGWALGALALFVFAYPLWRGLRDLETRGFRLPMWIVMGGSVLLVSGGALVFLAERV
jgi:hypothetical protein